MQNGDYEVVSALRNTADWNMYHNIRFQELFEAKGRGSIYDRERPEERAPNNYPILLKYKGQGVGTVRFDFRLDGNAAIRLVAITKSEQGKGHGHVLGQMIEKFARERRVPKLLVNAAPEAIGYYEKLGFVRDNWDPSELCGISADSIQMSKELLYTYSHWGPNPDFSRRIAEANAIYGHPSPEPSE